jgi:ADP-ribose pyrophosphatase
VRDEPASFPVERTTVHFTGNVITGVTDGVRMPSGDVVDRDYVRHPGAVGILALDGDEQVLLLRQYRHPPRRMLWEPPAGILDVADEPPLETAKRELYEEAHAVADRWDVLADVLTSPGMSDEALRIYLARGVRAADGEPHERIDEEADMPVEWVPLDDGVRLVLDGTLHNPTAVIGILAAAAARARGWSGLRPADASWPDRPHGRPAR